MRASLNLFEGDAGLLGDDLHLDLGRHVGDAVRRQVLEVAAHLGGRHLDIAHQLALHLPHPQTVAHVLAQRLTNLAGGLVEVFLHLLARADGGNILVGLKIHLADDLALGHLDTVQFGLVEEEFLHGNLFGYHAIGIRLEATALPDGLEARLLDLGLEDGLVAHHPYYFVHHIVLRKGGHAQAKHQDT